MKYFYCFLILLLMSCQSTIDKPMNTETFMEDMVKIKSNTDYDSSDYATLTMALGLGKAFGKEMKKGNTYREALDEIKAARLEVEAERKKQEIAYAKALKEWEDQTELLSKTVHVTVLRKEFQQDKYGIRKVLGYEYEIENTSGKQIKGVKGSVRILDTFGDELTFNGVKYEEPLKSGEKKVFALWYDYSDYDSGSAKIKESSLDKLTIKWEPEMIVFNDGKILEAPEKPKATNL